MRVGLSSSLKRLSCHAFTVSAESCSPISFDVSSCAYTLSVCADETSTRVWKRPILSALTSRQLVWATSDCLPIGDAAVSTKTAVEALSTMRTGRLIEFSSMYARALAVRAGVNPYKRKSRERTTRGGSLLQMECQLTPRLMIVARHSQCDEELHRLHRIGLDHAASVP